MKTALAVKVNGDSFENERRLEKEKD